MPSFSLLFHCFFLFLCLLLSNPLTPTLHSPQSSHSFLLYSSLIPSVFTVVNLSFSVSFVLHFPFMTHTTFIATLLVSSLGHPVFSPHKHMTLLHIFLSSCLLYFYFFFNFFQTPSSYFLFQSAFFISGKSPFSFPFFLPFISFSFHRHETFHPYCITLLCPLIPTPFLLSSLHSPLLSRLRTPCS